MRRQGVIPHAMKLSIALFWIAVLMLPLTQMLSTMKGVDVWKVVQGRAFATALRQSLVVSSVATILSVSLGGLLAWCTARTRIRYKGVIGVLLTIPMLIPSISHGMGLIILLGSNGVIRNMLGLGGSIYGFWGIVVGSAMYSMPVAYLMISDILKYEDYMPYEAASVLGISKRHQFTAITLPYVRKPMISVVFAVFTMVVTDYGVPLMIGGKYNTLPVLMYQEVIGLLDFGKGSVIGLVLLLPAIVTCILDVVNRDKGNLSFVAKNFEISKSRARDVAAYAICILVCLIVMLPIISFSFLSFIEKYPANMAVSLRNVLMALEMNAGKYLWNSLLIATMVSVFGVGVAIITAYLSARMPSRITKGLHLLSITSLAIPGIVLGLSYVLFFKGTLLYGSFAILILVNLVHFFASPYLMLYNSFGKLNENLEAVGMTLGVGRMSILRDVLLPQTKATLIEMFSYFFVNSMITISAVSFLSTVLNKPVSLMINQLEAQTAIEAASFISLLILIVNLIVKGGIYLYKRGLIIKEVCT